MGACSTWFPSSAQFTAELLLLLLVIFYLVFRSSGRPVAINTAEMARVTVMRISAALLPVLLLLGSAQAAPTVRSDNSPICNSVFPQCQAKCKQGQDYMFVCSAGNGPQGGPYILCQCVAPAMPVGPKAQGELVLQQHKLQATCFVDMHNSHAESVAAGEIAWALLRSSQQRIGQQVQQEQQQQQQRSQGTSEGRW
jgi:hypothetical protein